jgi:hypothetical protein
VVSTGNCRSRLCELPFYLRVEGGEAMGGESCCQGCGDREGFFGEGESAIAMVAAGGAVTVPMSQKP